MQEGSLVSFPIFRSFAKLLCLVSTRPGGFSLGGYAGLNLGKHTGDLSSSVCKNRDYFFHRLSLTEQQVAFGEQVHSANVRRVDEAGIIENTLERFKSEPAVTAGRIIAAIGPGLQSECFEVRKDVYELFAQRYLSVHPEADKKYLNLRQVIVDKLLQQGVPEEQIGWNSECTFCSAEKYYSYRRDGKNSGRMMGIIGIQ
jgi:copper oxidase (laccase) domain-containing protein